MGIMIIFGFLFYLNQTVLNLDPNSIQSWILSIGILAPFVFVMLYSVRPFMLFPASILSLAGGLAFGPIYGTVLTIIGATIGAYLSFLFARKVGARRVEERMGSKTEKLQSVLEKNGFTVVLVLRLIPLFNFDLISYAAGLSKVKKSHFLIATVIGIIPGTFAYNFLGASTVSDNSGKFILALIIFAVAIIVPVLFRKRIKRFLSL